MGGDESESGGAGGAEGEEEEMGVVAQPVMTDVVCSGCCDSRVGETGKCSTADCGEEKQEWVMLEDQGK